MVERLPGAATASESAVAARRFGVPPRALPFGDLVVAPVGLGTGGSRLDDPEHRRSVADALRAGVNFVDVDLDEAGRPGAALVGTMLRSAVVHDGLPREGVVLAGHSHAATIEAVEAAVLAGLEALGVAHLDVLFVPASLATDARARWAEDERIGAVGVLCDRPPDLEELEELDWATATVVRVPLGLFDLHTGVAAIERAHAAGVFVVGVRPLSFRNADGLAIALRAPPAEAPSWRTAKAVLGRVRRLEARWAAGLGARLRVGDGEDDAADLFAWGQVIATRLGEFDTLEAWQTARYEIIAPHLGRTSAALLQSLPDEPRAEFGQWWTEYGLAMHEAFDAIEAALRSAPQDLSTALEQRLAPRLPEPWRAWSLPKQAVALVAASGVDVVVVGMRRPSHVHEIIGLREDQALWAHDAAAERPSGADVQAISQDLAEFAQELAGPRR